MICEQMLSIQKRPVEKLKRLRFGSTAKSTVFDTE
jgi:hypothetical protein